MTAWRERARLEILKGTRKPTSNADERSLTAVTTVSNQAKSEISGPKKHWGWRIIHQNGTEVEAYFSPAVTRDQALKLSPGAVEAIPIPERKATTPSAGIPADLVRLIRVMGEHWHYSDEDYETAFQGARSDPSAWRVLCLEDQRRFGWQVPKVLSPGDIEQAVTEAVDERRAILEHEAKLKAERADAITKLAADFYRHLFGVAYETRCCKPRSGVYCDEGRRLHDAYCGATS